MKLRRLDAELVRRGLAHSREHAQGLVMEGAVLVEGLVVTKSARQVGDGQSIVVAVLGGEKYVSRGAQKLLGALSVFEPEGLTVSGRFCLDAGASTGGFTQVLLRRGAAGVVAVDVGYGQLSWQIRSDNRVVVLERTNVRYLEPFHLPYQPGLIVADLSFISLTTVLPALVKLLLASGDAVVMVKPQFEIGRELLGRGGVVRNPEHRVAAVRKVVGSAAQAGLEVQSVASSPLPGPSGNVEYFLWLRSDAPGVGEQEIHRLVAEGPQ
jgi:23S rRNA (cytidine1920-2'-O)/16S rRNA (cytidine1409-2'-O)-methyltransferase